MILVTACVIKVFLVIVALVSMRVFVVAKRKDLIVLAVLVIIFAMWTNIVIEILPPLTDTVTLTAVGESRAEAKGTEIFLGGYTIDGKKYLANNTLEVQAGKWFWMGKYYVWRPETDDRQPEGVTRTIVLNVPVGWNRSLDFCGNEYRGLVEINAREGQYLEDTYTSDGTMKSVQIDRSESFILILNQVRYLVVYVIVLLIFVLVIVCMYLKRQSVLAFIKRHLYLEVMLSLSFACFFYLWHYAPIQSFWGDELLQICFSSKDASIIDTLRFCFTFNDYSPPLYGVVLNLWYKIAPYGEKWILLPGIIGISGTVFLTGILSKKVAAKEVGLLAAPLVAISYPLICYAGLELRSYSFLTFLTQLLLLQYIRYNEKRDVKRSIAFISSMVLIAYTHYMGILFCGAVFLIDVVILNKGFKPKRIAQYICAGICYLPWIAAIIPYINNRAVAWSQSRPTPSALFSRIQSLVSNQIILLFLLMLGTSVVFWIQAKRHEDTINMMILTMSMWFVVVGTYFFGIAGAKSITFNGNRYYLCFIPQAMIICAFSIYWFLEQIFDKQSSEKSVLMYKIFSTGIFLFALLVNANSVYGIITAEGSYGEYGNGYRPAAEWLMSQNDIYAPWTCVVLPRRKEVAEGWTEYYLTKSRRQDAPKVFSTDEISDKTLCNYRTVYMLISSPTGNVEKALEEFTLNSKNTTLNISVYKRP